MSPWMLIVCRHVIPKCERFQWYGRTSMLAMCLNRLHVQGPSHPHTCLGLSSLAHIWGHMSCNSCAVPCASRCARVWTWLTNVLCTWNTACRHCMPFQATWKEYDLGGDGRLCVPRGTTIWDEITIEIETFLQAWLCCQVPEPCAQTSYISGQGRDVILIQRVDIR